MEVPTPAVEADRAEIARLEATLNTPTPELARGQAAFEQAMLATLPSWIASTIAALREHERRAKEERACRGVSRDCARTQAERDRLAALQKKLNEERVTTLVMQELPTPRKTHVFVGGSFLNPGDEVAPGVPAVLGSIKRPDRKTAREAGCQTDWIWPAGWSGPTIR